MFNRIEIYLIHNSFLHAELYRITHVTTTFWRNFMRYTYVSEKFNLNWYNGGIVYNTSIKMKKKILRFFLLWDNILSSFGRTLDSTHFFNVIIQLFSCLWKCKISVRFEGFFLLCIEIWQARGASQRWNLFSFFVFFIFVINIVLTLSYL